MVLIDVSYVVFCAAAQGELLLWGSVNIFNQPAVLSQPFKVIRIKS